MSDDTKRRVIIAVSLIVAVMGAVAIHVSLPVAQELRPVVSTDR